MCGIAGFSGSFDPALLEEMDRRIAHRGPDDHDTWYLQSEGVGLVHRRLTIIDLSERGRQPMWDVKRRAVMIFNGEIFNYRELRRELEADGVAFNSQTDSEVILNLYLEEGPSMLARLNGMFALAIWDMRRKELFLARDGLGVKPLYYSQTNKGFVFASELKALLAVDDLNRELDPLAIHHHLAYLWCPAPGTMFRSVHKLEPGHYLLVRDGKVVEQKRYYQIPFDQPIEQIAVEEAVEDVYHHLRQAVERQMVADVPVGAFLSGGLDSSSVAALAREFSPNKLQCFSIDLRGQDMTTEGMADDLPYAKKVAEHLDVDLHLVKVGSEMVDYLEDMIYHLDEPQADPAPVNALLICRLAREHGIKVLLSGAGGDDVFTGYRRHRALMLEQHWSWLPGAARAGIQGITQLAPAQQAWGRRLRKAFSNAHLEGDRRLIGYFYWITEEVQRSLYGPGLRDALGDVPREAPLLRTLEELPENTPPLNRMLFLELKHFLCDHNLNYTDKMSMAEGVEVRVPLLDVDLIARAARLPLDYKQRGAVGKWIFKRAAERLLPKDVIYRPKTGFGAPIRHWLRHQLRPVVDDLLSAETIKNRGLFDPAGVKRLVEMDRAGSIDGSYTIFSLMCMEWWCRRFADRG